VKTFSVQDSALKDKRAKVRCKCGAVLFELKPNQTFTKSKTSIKCGGCGKLIKAAIRD
jgi:ribosomal protein S27E